MVTRAGGELEASAELLEDLLRVWGPDHPHTLTTRRKLAQRHAKTSDLA